MDRFTDSAILIIYFLCCPENNLISSEMSLCWNLYVLWKVRNNMASGEL